MSAYFEKFKLGKTYKTPKGDAVIVKNFNLKMKKGEFVCVIGHSGCGKSTVLSMVAGLNEITEGGVILDGNEISGAAPDRGVVFQSPCLLPWMSAWDNVMLGVNQVYYHASRAERKQIVEYYLTSVGLSGSFNKRPDELSGGMRKRVGLARAFSLSPKIVKSPAVPIAWNKSMLFFKKLYLPGLFTSPIIVKYAFTNLTSTDGFVNKPFSSNEFLTKSVICFILIFFT